MANLNFTQAPHHTSLPSSSTCSAFPSYANSYPYDVFINHRGPDTKSSIASDLHSTLTAHQLRVFLDKEMEKGDFFASQIANAIRTASVHLAIFSPHYAESEWCLNELLLMLETMETGQSTIIPIFYRVKVADLRWKKGMYAEALKVLQNKKSIDSQTQQERPRYDSNTIQKWRNALSYVSYIYGFELEQENNGDKKPILNEIVQLVLQKVKKILFRDKNPILDEIVQLVLQKVKKPALEVSKYPIGLDQKVKEFEELLKQQQSGVIRVIGVVGFGGIGKTTLAKEIFNRERSNYRQSCFLFDIRENSLTTFQSDLMKDLTQLDEQIRSPEEGKGKLRRNLSSKQALIILDNVDHPSQLNALLLPARDALHPSSLIIVTSRDKQVLINKDIKESSIYMLKCLNEQHSRELFCLHAFGQPQPVAGFEELVQKFSVACQGLPLSLTVLGEHLSGINDLIYWTAELDKISKILPEDVQNRLRISYDGLDIHQKQIFLDIACFFIGEDRETAIRVWDGSEWGGYQGIWILQSRCLVEVDRKNRIRMHDHLRDLGRDIAKNETPHRLWRPTHNLLHCLQDQSPVRGIHLVEQRSTPPFENPVELGNHFLGMRMLELLRAEGDCLKIIFSSVQSRHLIWLRWYRCPYSCLPFWIRRDNLRVLHVDGSKLKTVWGESNFEEAVELRELHINAPLLKIPNSIKKLKYLEKIVLEHGELKTFPNEFCHLQSLKHLELRSCSIESLPDCFGKLQNLQHIELHSCCNLKLLPNSFGTLMRLEYLSLQHCGQLTISRECFGKISTLERLYLSYCLSIEDLPQVANNRLLREVILLGTSLTKLPDDIGNLINLRVLHLESNSEMLEKLPDSLSNLRNLEQLILENCRGLTCLPNSIGKLQSLQNLRVLNCFQLKGLPGSIGRLNRLKNLEIKTAGVDYLALPPRVPQKNNSPVSCMIVLEELKLFDIKISKVSFPKDVCPNLQRLEIRQCERLVEVGALPTTLLSLKLKKCYALKKMRGQKNLGFDGAEELPGVQTSICSDEGIVNCPESTEGLAQLTKLEVLEVEDCCELEELPGLENLTSLRDLYASGCGKLQWLPSLERLVSLETLVTSACVKLKSIVGLAQLSNLTVVNVVDCWDLEELPGIKHLKSLRYLYATRCGKLQSIEGLGQLTELRLLDVEGCCELRELPSLQHLASLRKLVAIGCGKLQSIRGLAPLTDLEELNVEHCCNLEVLEGFGYLKSLKMLNIQHCSKLRVGGAEVKKAAAFNLLMQEWSKGSRG